MIITVSLVSETDSLIIGRSVPGGGRNPRVFPSSSPFSLRCTI